MGFLIMGLFYKAKFPMFVIVWQPHQALGCQPGWSLRFWLKAFVYIDCGVEINTQNLGILSINYYFN